MRHEVVSRYELSERLPRAPLLVRALWLDSVRGLLQSGAESVLRGSSHCGWRRAQEVVAQLPDIAHRVSRVLQGVPSALDEHKHSARFKRYAENDLNATKPETITD